MLLRKLDEDKNVKKIKEKLDKRREIIEAIEEIDNLKDEVLRLSNKLKEKDEENKESYKNADLLNQLFQKGIIDSEGNLFDNS